MSRAETIAGVEEVSTIIRSKLKASPVYLSTLNEIIKGCRTLKAKDDRATAVQLRTKIASFLEIARGLHGQGNFNQEAFDALMTYQRLLEEGARNN